MIRTTTMAALALALMSSAAFAQSSGYSNGPPAQLSGGQSYDDRAAPPPTAQSYDDRNNDRDYNDRDYDDRDAPPPSSAQAQNNAQNDNRAPDPQRDVYCRRSAA